MTECHDALDWQASAAFNCMADLSFARVSKMAASKFASAISRPNLDQSVVVYVSMLLTTASQIAKRLAYVCQSLAH